MSSKCDRCGTTAAEAPLLQGYSQTLCEPCAQIEAPDCFPKGVDYEHDRRQRRSRREGGVATFGALAVMLYVAGTALTVRAFWTLGTFDGNELARILPAALCLIAGALVAAIPARGA